MANPYNNFRRPSEYTAAYNTISRRFDQPTYVSFKLVFGSTHDWNYNGAGLGTLVNYDIMPHPLFMPEGNEEINDRVRYSSIDYLKDSNEYTRASMMQSFIVKWNALQYNFPWYFKKIDGVQEMLKVQPKNGQRILNDHRLVITAMEGIDLRVTHLLNLYKKIAWDDTYQRWVLPDMMRYFTLDIYISEFRTFHTPNQYNALGYGSIEDQYEEGELWLKAMDNTLPTWVIKCEMCEFDLESINFNYLANLGVDEAPDEAGIQFSIKVGNINEMQVYPMFKNMYLLDKSLNGFDRIKETDIGVTFNADTNAAEDTEIEFDSTSLDQNNNRNKGYEVLGIAQDTLGQEKTHLSNTPFNERANDKSLYGVTGPGPDGKYFTDDDKYTPDPTKSNTWVGNAAGFAGSYVTGKVDDYVNKLKVNEIPGLGFSPTELQSAIQSKNIFSTLGLLKNGADRAASEILPSELLDQGFDQGGVSTEIFKQMLLEISTSQATDEDNIFIKTAAITALNDDNIFAKVNDLSLATDLVGEGEINVEKNVFNKNYPDVVADQTGNDRSTATDLDGGPMSIQLMKIYDGAPSSAATSNTILKG